MTSLALLQDVGPKSGTPGIAAEGAAPAGGAAPPPGGGWIMFLPLLMLVPIFLMQGRRQKKEAAARSKLKKGDRVLTNSGLVGELVEMDERFAKVKIAPGITVQMVSSTVSFFNATATTETTRDSKAPEKDAKLATEKK